jgi:hypothetical protein
MKKPSIKLFLVLCQYVLLNNLCAQSVLQLAKSQHTNPEPGYVISLAMDTLKGMVEYADWATSPETILFKDAGGGDLKQYSASDLFGFAVTSRNEFFKSAHVLIKDYSGIVNNEIKNPSFKTNSSDAFLEVLLKRDSFSLMRYLDYNEDATFFIDNVDTLMQLVNVKFAVSQQGKIFNVSYPYYRIQLTGLLRDCKNLSTETLAYNERALTSLYNRYLKCTHQPLQFQIQPGRNMPLKVSFNSGFIYVAQTPAFTLGATIQYHIDKKFSSRFITLGVGRGFVDRSKEAVSDKGKRNFYYVSLYGGTYFGTSRLKPFVFTGFSNLLGPLDTGVGLSKNKRHSILCRSGLFDLVQGVGNFAIEARFAISRK